MKHLQLLILLISISPSGCASGPYAQQGATLGAFLGAPVGAVIGSGNGEAAAGALIGGTVGALAGSNLGSNIDAQNLAVNSERSQPMGLTYEDIFAMSRNGLGEEVIMTQIQNQGLRIRPTTHDLIQLKNAGFSDRLIQTVQNSQFTIPARPHRQTQSPVIVEEHYWGTPCLPAHPWHFGPQRTRRGSSISFSHRF